MSLKSQINSDIKAAMLAKEKEKLEALRAVKSAILLAETEKGGDGELPEEKEVAIVQKLVKQRRDSATLYMEQGREDLAGPENFQADIVAKYLPEQMGEEDVREVVAGVIAQVGASGPGDMGKVMGPTMGKLKGKADGKLISQVVKELLNQ